VSRAASALRRLRARATLPNWATPYEWTGMTGSHTDIFLVRHGQTDSNIAGLFHGATDVPLNAIGLRQARLVAQRVAQLGQLDALHTSPLQRAVVTARAIADETGLEPVITTDLIEMHFGAAEGLTLAEMAERFPALAERFRDLSDNDVGFPGGETRRAFHARVRQSVERIVTAHAGQRVVVVAHGGVIGSIVAQILQGDPNDWRRYPVANCSITHLEFHVHGPVARLLNDTVHLEELNVPEASER
jgi:broad specificity phosphatase PhoE